MIKILLPPLARANHSPSGCELISRYLKMASDFIWFVAGILTLANQYCTLANLRGRELPPLECQYVLKFEKCTLANNVHTLDNQHTMVKFNGNCGRPACVICDMQKVLAPRFDI